MAGRPSLYKPEFAEQARKLCNLGATNRDLADFFEVSERTIERWISEKEEFHDSVSVGKGGADMRVERSLYHRAVGYSHPDVDIKVVDGGIVETPITKYYPPDTKACLAWLYNRKPDNWHPQPDGKVGDEKISEVISKLIDKLPG